MKQQQNKNCSQASSLSTSLATQLRRHVIVMVTEEHAHIVHPLPQRKCLSAPQGPKSHSRVKKDSGADVMECCCNPRSLEAEAGGSGFLGQPGLHNEILSQKRREKGRERMDGGKVRRREEGGGREKKRREEEGGGRGGKRKEEEGGRRGRRWWLLTLSVAVKSCVNYSHLLPHS